MIRQVLVGVSGNDHVHPDIFLRDLLDAIGEVILGELALQAHVTGQHDGIHLFVTQFAHGVINRLHRVFCGEIPQQARGQPRWQTGSDRANDPNFESSHFFDDVGLDLGQRMRGIVQLVGPLPADLCVGSQDRAGRGLDHIDHGIKSPVEFMISHHPRIVVHAVEQLHHQLPLRAPGDVRPLVNITHVNEHMMGIFLLPGANLRDAARQSTHILHDRAILLRIHLRRNNVPVQVRGVENGNDHLVPILSKHGCWQRGHQRGSTHAAKKSTTVQVSWRERIHHAGA